MSWLSLALSLLKIASILIDWAKTKQAMDAGEDKAIAEASAGILAKTQTAKDVMKHVTGLTDSQVDDALKELEP